MDWVALEMQYDGGDEIIRREVQWLRGFQVTCDLGPDGVELGTKVAQGGFTCSSSSTTNYVRP
jgi:hypothetical protein